MILPITAAWHFHAFLPSESVTGLSSAGGDDPLHNFLAFLAPRWPLDADERFTVPEASANSVADGLRPSWLADSVRGEREMSRTLPADRRSDKPTFWALWVGTRTTLPKYDVRQRCKKIYTRCTETTCCVLGVQWLHCASKNHHPFCGVTDYNCLLCICTETLFFFISGWFCC